MIIQKGGDENMNGFIGDIEKLTKENNFFRKVIFTGTHTQLVVMCLKPGEQIGREIHPLVSCQCWHYFGVFYIVFSGNEAGRTERGTLLNSELIKFFNNRMYPLQV